ncbi:hypothetical protein OPT61_g4329 [Boeremia exigua]|uniref:Uncharacterized protein n=1 Tax=Boeremia exigua TaxID=749465 RepID=A0ACC2IEQ4_9PLEO|nr:hypothetical protein OPT61_g4329 [Boeremia exigua]
MTERRSARAAGRAAVKYTSDSEGSDFGEKTVKRSKKKSTQATPKRGTKRSQASNGETDKTPKRRKKSPETLAAEYKEKSKKQEEKAEKEKAKQQWEGWLSENDVSGKLLDAEPEREDCVTQTDAQKQYGLKADELITLKHFEKPNQYGGQTKLFLTADVKKVAFRKYGLLAGLTDEKRILEKGEELWKSEHVNDAQSSPKKPEKEAAPKPKTSKQKWAAYVEEHSVGDKKLSEAPEDSINQTDCKTEYQLLPSDLACLPHFPKPNPKYGNTTKLFSKPEVRDLAYRKAATVAGIDDTMDTEEFLSKGKELLGPAEDAEA